jgi:iron uptake system EfeUOB component EfeO/EfeM
MSWPHTGRLAALVAIGAILAGCGGHQARRAGAEETLQVGITEYRIVPDNLTVPEGAVTIIVHNYGILTHNLSVTNGSQTEGTTEPIWPGTSTELTVALLPGKYQMASTLLSDQSLGIYGTLTVTS